MTPKPGSGWLLSSPTYSDDGTPLLLAYVYAASSSCNEWSRSRHRELLQIHECVIPLQEYFPVVKSTDSKDSGQSRMKYR